MPEPERVYLPATLHTLAQLRDRGELAGDRAHAVTAALRARYADAEADELEYVAHTHAAQDALRLLSADPTAPRRRVVVAADVPVALPESVAHDGPPSGSSRIRLPGPVPRDAVAAIHVDGADAEPDIAAASAGVGSEHDEPDAGSLSAVADEHELEWYDVSELDQLLA